jgi:hypothetical protein
VEIRRAKNTWRFDPVDQAYTLVTGNRRLDLIRPKIFGSLATPSLAAQEKAAQSLRALGMKNEFLDAHGEGENRWVAFPSPTPLVFVEEEKMSPLPLVSSGALGAHEVLCAENRSLDGLALDKVPSAQWSDLLQLFRIRAVDLARDLRLSFASLLVQPPFCNRFPLFHGQLLALPSEPLRQKEKTTCGACEDHRAASAQGSVLSLTKRFIAYAPFAPRSSLHIRIACRAHLSFTSEDMTKDDVAELGVLIHDVLKVLHSFFPQGTFGWSFAPTCLRNEEADWGTHSVVNIELQEDADGVWQKSFGFRVSNLPPMEMAKRLRPLFAAPL